ncbi:arylamine N-acetyltransferase [Bacillus thermotolerans]|uniref:arylamine N-acetyltransferase n=1 Tax=Bacillus thermotolerans TaxID=1221996 RepID=UPI00057DC7EF|nr:arylamine N-acetyltransferase [Bacillus thermotolerans]KKB37056.1 hypothetical protein QY97_00617 [Bacillus thermotolerans]
MDAASVYLQKLKMGKEPPTVNYLQRLILNHLSLIPYETFSKFHYYRKEGPKIPDFQTFVANLESRGWGGTCYSLNVNFARLLMQLGFTCSLVRVLPGHAGIMVHIEGRRFYVDVGYGSPITRPVDLESKAHHLLHGFGEEILFTRRGKKTFLLERQAHGKVFATKEIIWEPLTEEELQSDIEASYADSSDNIAMRRISAVRFQGNQCYFLRDHTLKVIDYRGIREHCFQRQDQWIQAVTEAFHVEEQGVQEAVRFLADRGVSLFK